MNFKPLGEILDDSIFQCYTHKHISKKYAGVVQLVERLLAKEKVVGSSPIARSSICKQHLILLLATVLSGDVAKW